LNSITKTQKKAFISLAISNLKMVLYVHCSKPGNLIIVNDLSTRILVNLSQISGKGSSGLANGAEIITSHQTQQTASVSSEVETESLNASHPAESSIFSYQMFQRHDVGNWRRTSPRPPQPPLVSSSWLFLEDILHNLHSMAFLCRQVFLDGRFLSADGKTEGKAI